LTGSPATPKTDRDRRRRGFGRRGGNGEGGRGNHGHATADQVGTYPSLHEHKPFQPFPYEVKVEVPKPEKLPGEGSKDRPVTKIDLHPVADADMLGALCRLEILSDNETNLRVEINKEHDVVQELLRARPINRMALHLMVTREIASALVEYPGMIKRSLAPKIIKVLDALPDSAQKERKLARILMDSARRPKVVEAA
jgi:hypothetical protein